MATVAEDLDLLRAEWGNTGTPPNAAAQIAAVVARHIGGDGRLRHKTRTPNEGDWCELCCLPRDGHVPAVTVCPGVFLAPAKRDREPGEEG